MGDRGHDVCRGGSSAGNMQRSESLTDVCQKMPPREVKIGNNKHKQQQQQQQNSNNENEDEANKKQRNEKSKWQHATFPNKKRIINNMFQLLPSVFAVVVAVVLLIFLLLLPLLFLSCFACCNGRVADVAGRQLLAVICNDFHCQPQQKRDNNSRNSDSDSSKSFPIPKRK